MKFHHKVLYSVLDFHLVTFGWILRIDNLHNNAFKENKCSNQWKSAFEMSYICDCSGNIDDSGLRGDAFIPSQWKIRWCHLKWLSIFLVRVNKFLVAFITITYSIVNLKYPNVILHFFLVMRFHTKAFSVYLFSNHHPK